MDNVEFNMDAKGITKYDLAKRLGISRTTLDKRLDLGGWKKGELFLLKSILG